MNLPEISTKEGVKYATKTALYKSLGPADPTHPHLVQLYQIKPLFCLPLGPNDHRMTPFDFELSCKCPAANWNFSARRFYIDCSVNDQNINQNVTCSQIVFISKRSSPAYLSVDSLDGAAAWQWGVGVGWGAFRTAQGQRVYTYWVCPSNPQFLLSPKQTINSLLLPTHLLTHTFFPHCGI